MFAKTLIVLATVALLAVVTPHVCAFVLCPDNGSCSWLANHTQIAPLGKDKFGF